MRTPVAVRLALRELRGGLAGFRVFLACLALGVAAIAAVGLGAGRDRGRASPREAATLLGGDAEIEFTYRFADADERAWMDANAAAVSEIVDFRSMVDRPAPGRRARARAGAGQGGRRPLPAVRHGRTRRRRQPRRGAGAGRTACRGWWRTGVLIDRLGLAPATCCASAPRTSAWPPARRRARRRRRRLRLRAAGDRAPGPTSTESGLLSEGSLFDSSYRLRLPPEADLAALEAEAEARFGDTGLQWRDRRDGAPGIGRFVDRLGAFLVLVGLAGLAVGGVGVAAAVRAHLEGKTATIATLKTLGATGGTVFAVYLTRDRRCSRCSASRSASRSARRCR